MPGVAPPVEGVANVRGTLVTVVRGEVVLGGPLGAGWEPSPWLVVLSLRGGRVGLGVDDVVSTEDGLTAVALAALDDVLAAVIGEAKS